MAAEKKKTSEKKNEKKPVKKAVAKPAGKKSKRLEEVGSNHMLISVPKGGQVIRFFELTPSLPVGGCAADWILDEVGGSGQKDISGITVGFPENPSAIERDFERAILVINLKQGASGPAGTWRFAMGGVATDQADSDPNNDIAIDIIDNGLTMLVHVHVLNNSVENIRFGYVASFTYADSGVVEVYESQDPGFVPIRPIG